MNKTSTSQSFPPIRPDAWLLDPNVVFINHGSFGACPKGILARQTAIREEIEREPVDFLVRKMPPLVDRSRAALADLIGADPADLAFVHNATAGVNAVLRSLDFQPGDEILTTVHDYNACRNVARYVAERAGARVVVADLPLPITSPEQVVETVLGHLTSRTRLALIDHITSPTALIFPIERLVGALNERGIDTLVDGAHAPGMIPLDLRRIGAAYYTGNCHKWLCAPKGAGFLHVRPDRQKGIQPPIVSHGWNRPRSGYTPLQDGFDWPGTFDPSAWICVGEAIRFVNSLLPGGLTALMRRNHDLAMLGRRMLCERLRLEPVGPEEMLGSMAAVRLPDCDLSPLDPGEEDILYGDTRYHDRLLDRYGIEVPVYHWPAAPRMVVRISAQAYNYPAQYERLVAAIPAIEEDKAGRRDSA
ncbi:MAG: aminotransferase class V-fold PLP-dependent enzyme [Pirellulaceae bacterium]|nr:aminotransferase class V-fold PLP-dependent enzyme [Pirellulaceae bacterium]